LHGQRSGFGGVFRNDKQSKNPLPVLWQWGLKILVKELDPDWHVAQHILSVMNPRNGTDSSCIFGANLAGSADIDRDPL
jgi:hypothetical protein